MESILAYDLSLVGSIIRQYVMISEGGLILLDKTILELLVCREIL